MFTALVNEQRARLLKNLLSQQNFLISRIFSIADYSMKAAPSPNGALMRIIIVRCAFVSPSLPAPTKKHQGTHSDVSKYIISHFFAHASVRLLAFRLLPPLKKKQQRVVYMAFRLCLLETGSTPVTSNFSRIPFNADWEAISKSE